MKILDITGQKYGRLLVVKESGRTKSQEKLWECICDCGNRVVVRSYSLRSGETKSCGCLQREKTSKANTRHGDTNSSLWRRYQHMKWRCNNSNCKDYKNYGERGIKICDKWKTYQGFKEWALNNGYKENLTIDRIDVNGDYSPENCRWIPLEDQQRNRRNNIYLSCNGISKTISEWARILNVKDGKINYLKRKGLSDKEIFNHFPDVAELLEKMKEVEE